MDKNKSLKDKAISLKGKQYVEVYQRVLYFNDNYPSGCIHAEIVKITDNGILFKAIVYPEIKYPLKDEQFKEDKRFFTGHAYMKLSEEFATEKAETSAVGRALGLMGIGVIDGIASADEVRRVVTKATITNTNVCPKCGAPMKVSTKNGRAYCSAICWENNK